MKKFILITTFMFICTFLYPSTFVFSPSSKDYFIQIYQSSMKEVYKGNLSLSSGYVEGFVKNNYGITNFTVELKILSNSVLVNVSSESTNLSITRFPVPFIEALEVFYLLGISIDDFSSFGVYESGSIKIFKLDYKSGNAYLLFYFDKGQILRVDYWLKDKEDIMLWSYLCAYDTLKSTNKKYLSGILLNVQTKEFYKFDFSVK
ncbi:MAG: hypothetical protein ACP5PT_00140 [Brevinematia bacterium]